MRYKLFEGIDCAEIIETKTRYTVELPEVVERLNELEREKMILQANWVELKWFIENHRYGPIRKNRCKILRKMEALENE